MVSNISQSETNTKMKKILITGGAGFVGSNLCSRLVNENNFVICVDNLDTGKISNIQNLLKNDNFKFFNHDIVKVFDYNEKIDEIYNLACPASPPSYQRDPIQTLKTCTIGTINILELALRNRSKVLQASTSEIYGDPLTHPQNENYWGNVNPIGIRSCYDEGKRCSETLFMDYNRKFKLETKIVRIFNTYGKNMDKNDGRVISNFINQAIKNNELTIYGDGSQTRSFLFIDDLIDGLLLSMRNNYFSPINLGNPNEISMNDLADLILRLTKSSSEKVFLPLPFDDPKRRKPDISLANKILSWKPSTDLEKGLLKTISFYSK